MDWPQAASRTRDAQAAAIDCAGDPLFPGPEHDCVVGNAARTSVGRRCALALGGGDAGGWRARQPLDPALRPGPRRRSQRRAQPRGSSAGDTSQGSSGRHLPRRCRLCLPRHLVTSRCLVVDTNEEARDAARSHVWRQARATSARHRAHARGWCPAMSTRRRRLRLTTVRPARGQPASTCGCRCGRRDLMRTRVGSACATCAPDTRSGGWRRSHASASRRACRGSRR